MLITVAPGSRKIPKDPKAFWRIFESAIKFQSFFDGEPLEDLKQLQIEPKIPKDL